MNFTGLRIKAYFEQGATPAFDKYKNRVSNNSWDENTILSLEAENEIGSPIETAERVNIIHPASGAIYQVVRREDEDWVKFLSRVAKQMNKIYNKCLGL